MALSDIDRPQIGALTLRLPNVGPSNGPAGPSGVELSKFLEYSYSESFLTPVDGGEFTIDAAELSDADRNAILPGARVRDRDRRRGASRGYLDEIRIRRAEAAVPSGHCRFGSGCLPRWIATSIRRRGSRPRNL